MAATIAVTCPECHKQINAPAELAGKKIRCKGCEHVFTVKAPPAARPDPKAKAKAKTKPQAPARARPAGEDQEDNPYGVNETELPPRCPHCAADLDTRDAVLCLNCGYNLQTREFMRTKKVVERTAGDWILWLLPAILSVVVALAIIGFDIFYIFFVEPPTDADWEASAFKWIVKWGGIKIWVVIFTLIGLFQALRFAIRRLVFNPVPPEKEG